MLIRKSQTLKSTSAVHFMAVWSSFVELCIIVVLYTSFSYVCVCVYAVLQCMYCQTNPCVGERQKRFQRTVKFPLELNARNILSTYSVYINLFLNKLVL